jgi:hypothetical protein
MILDFDSKMFLAALPGKSLRQRPRFQHAFHFQAEVVMQPARSMLLNDESRRAFDLFWSGLPAGSLVFLKSRLRLYSVSAIPTQINHGSRGSHGFRDRWIACPEDDRSSSSNADIRRTAH